MLTCRRLPLPPTGVQMEDPTVPGPLGGKHLVSGLSVPQPAVLWQGGWLLGQVAQAVSGECADGTVTVQGSPGNSDWWMDHRFESQRPHRIPAVLGILRVSLGKPRTLSEPVSSPGEPRPPRLPPCSAGPRPQVQGLNEMIPEADPDSERLTSPSSVSPVERASDHGSS